MGEQAGVATAWAGLLAIADARRAGQAVSDVPAAASGGDADVAELLALYRPLLQRTMSDSFVLAHLGQSLDGRIATTSGASHYITGAADLQHKHRLRALFDATVVGAGTVRHDNPRLTVRLVDGDNPVRVVIDTNRSLDQCYTVFEDAIAPTLVLCAADRINGVTTHGVAEVIGVPRAQHDSDALDATAVLATLKARGLTAVLLEGGGVTVSRFVQMKAVDRLQVTVAPLILGTGRAGLMLPEITHPDQGMRPEVRHFMLGSDVLFDCILHD